MSDAEENSIQWQTLGQGFGACGQTQKILDPGFYDIQDMGYGRMAMVPKTPITEADEIYQDIDGFLESKDRFAAYRLTHKRGYMFWGPPGSGKTSLANMLANRFIKGVGGIVVYCGDVSSFYSAVNLMKSVEPGRPTMYLIEEADRIVNNTHCLSILDGELSVQGAVFVAMTNYKNKMPPRVTNRPGRFDRVVRVDCPPEGVQVEYIRRLQGRVEGGPDVAQEIVSLLAGLPVSMAHLREAFVSRVLLKQNLEDIRTRYNEMFGIAAEQDDDDEDAFDEDYLDDSHPVDD